MEVDKQEAEAATTFAEKIGVFDKAPSKDTTPPTNKPPSQVSEPSIPQANWDRLVADVAIVKANQQEINKKLDLTLAFGKKLDLLLHILNKKEEQGKNNNDSDTTTSDVFLTTIIMRNVFNY